MQIVDNVIPSDLALIYATEEKDLLTRSMRYFDKDGFELTELEVLLHHYNGKKIANYLNHVTTGVDWLIQNNNESPVQVDHSMVHFRYFYDGEALDELNRLKYQRPELIKLTRIRPKWGIDIALDYVIPTMYVELLHFEYDTHSYDEILEVKDSIEQVIKSTDFEDAAISIWNRRDEWQHLCSDDQNDWRARYFGLTRCYYTQKVLV
jgi:hypothetical protein